MEQSPTDRTPHTLAQLARRAGISEGRARALHTATPSGLPGPDSADADGRPLWWAATIDAWCARTGRRVSDESLWLFRVPAATGPVPELQRSVATLSGAYRRQPFYAIVWDTELGHVIYLQPLQGAGGNAKDWLAHAAAELIEPRWWADAVVVMPMEESLSPYRDRAVAPVAEIYRLTERSPGSGSGSDPGGAFGGLRRWISRTSAPAAGPAVAEAKWVGQMDLADIAAVVGRPIPLWLDDTATTDNARQTLSYDRTFTTEDTVTEWPAAQARLTGAIEAGMPGEFPAAFAALAVDAAQGLAHIRSAHERIEDTGTGWYLVCRPARPAPPFDLEQRISQAHLVTDVDLVGTELSELRATEGDLDVDDPRGEVYAEAIALLEWQLRHAAKKAGAIRDLSHDYVPIADDGLLRYGGPWDGSVVDAWRKTLTPVEDLASALRLRRVRRLVGDVPLEDVREAYRDSAGRYVLVVHHNGADWSSAEWPACLHGTSHWSDKTVIAGDDEHGTTSTLLALTPTSDGRMRVDPVPLLPRSHGDVFAYGYSGGTPGTTYRALLRCVLGDSPGVPWGAVMAARRAADGAPASQLWAAISETTGPLRLSWPQLQLWARADKKHALANPDTR